MYICFVFCKSPFIVIVPCKNVEIWTQRFPEKRHYRSTLVKPFSLYFVSTVESVEFFYNHSTVVCCCILILDTAACYLRNNIALGILSCALPWQLGVVNPHLSRKYSHLVQTLCVCQVTCVGTERLKPRL